MNRDRRPPKIQASVVLHLVLSYFGATLISPLVMLLAFNVFQEFDLPYVHHLVISLLIGIISGMAWFVAFDAQALFNYKKHERAADARNELREYYRKQERLRESSEGDS